MSFTDLRPRVGSEVRIDKADLLAGTYASDIRALLEQRGVIVFRDMHLEDDELTAVGGTLGNVLMHGREGPQDPIIRVTFDQSQQRKEFGGYFRGTFFWHMDGMYDRVPPLASILSPRVLTETGGETEFVNTYAAYDDLPEADKRAYDRLEVRHSVTAAYKKIVAEPTEAQLAQWATRGEQVHSLVWHHRTGRKSLVNGHTADIVVGMDRAESDALLARLLSWATRPDYHYQHQWRMGDLLMWDNSGTMHRVLGYDLNSGRRLHRVTLLGEEPVQGAALEVA